ncbi:hypothetical protein [uncultured Winogradskyella sp.]|uniref:hypothetical protein n=1 Tax=Winogradskyella sp. 4-2091 TaxID=3381659 RepID=UPI00262E8D79|nr:hypothetical protein [uncultured Winogradskyella sp.]
MNTLEGNIRVTTNNATIEANSNHGEIDLDTFFSKISIWTLISIHGDITVLKQE